MQLSYQVFSINHNGLSKQRAGCEALTLTNRPPWAKILFCNL